MKIAAPDAKMSLRPEGLGKDSTLIAPSSVRVRALHPVHGFGRSGGPPSPAPAEAACAIFRPIEASINAMGEIHLRDGCQRLNLPPARSD